MSHLRSVGSHPEPETIASYIDGRLADDARELLERHLADCAKCREIWMEATEVLEAAPSVREASGPDAQVRVRWPPSYAWWLVAAASVLIAAGGWWWSPSQQVERAVSDLAAASGGRRFAQARLSIDHVWSPPSIVSRGAGAGAPTAEVLSVVQRIQNLTAEERSPAELRARGLANLAIADVNNAVSVLTRAQADAPYSVDAGIDLGAALIERYHHSANREDLIAAVRSLDAVLARDPVSLPALFNRALALDLLGTPDDARAAMRAYLAVDPGSEWAIEMRSRLNRLGELSRELAMPVDLIHTRVETN